MSSDSEKTCFFIAPIGEAGTQTREDSDRVLRRIVRPAVNPLGFAAIRADEISTPGIITRQVLELVVGSPLVIADLTGHNPNVFYELAIRHAIRKPFVQIIRENDTIPFDVAIARTVRYDFDVDSAQDAIDEITRQIESLESDPSDIETPISMSLDLQSLRAIADPQSSGLQNVLPLLEDINSAVHSNGNEIVRLRDNAQPRPGSGPIMDVDVHRSALSSGNAFGFLATVGGMRYGAPWLYEMGVAAYSEVFAGQPHVARNVLQQMLEMIGVRFPGSEDFVQSTGPELSTLLERLISAHQSTAINELDDLPF